MVRETLVQLWNNMEDTVVYRKVQDQIPWTKEQVMAEFKLDKDGEGRISKEELKAAFDKFGSRWSSFRAWRALCHADANKDGFISMEEVTDLVNYALKCGYKLRR